MKGKIVNIKLIDMLSNDSTKRCDGRKIEKMNFLLSYTFKYSQEIQELINTLQILKECFENIDVCPLCKRFIKTGKLSDE